MIRYLAWWRTPNWTAGDTEALGALVALILLVATIIVAGWVL